MGHVSDKTIGSYIGYLQDAFLIEKAERYDVKGRKHISSPFKYYFSDVGLRNARLNFRQQEENHIMENIIYCLQMQSDDDCGGVVGTMDMAYKKND